MTFASILLFLKPVFDFIKMLWEIELKIPVLLLMLIGLFGYWLHSSALSDALEAQSKQFVTVQEKATQEALKEAERDITTFLNKRNANNIAERERLEKIIQEHNQSASQKSQTLQDLEDEIQELLLRPSTLPTVGELRNQSTR